MHHLGRGHVIDTPGVRNPVGGGDDGISFGGRQSFRYNRNVGNVTVYITGSQVSLKSIGHIAVQCMVDGPYACIFVQALVPHEVLELRPVSFIIQPQAFIQSFQYFSCLFLIGCGVFSNFFGDKSGQLVGTIVVGR